MENNKKLTMEAVAALIARLITSGDADGNQETPQPYGTMVVASTSSSDSLVNAPAKIVFNKKPSTVDTLAYYRKVDKNVVLSEMLAAFVADSLRRKRAPATNARRDFPTVQLENLPTPSEQFLLTH